MKIEKFTAGSFQVNNYLIYSENSKNGLIIDAGEDTSAILKRVQDLNLKIKYLINTHGHGDHISGNPQILAKTGAELIIHEVDAPFLADPNLNLSIFFGLDLRLPPADKMVLHNDTLELDELKFKFLHTPGHTPGHISVVVDSHAFVGDVIFKNGIGRTDFPLSSHQELVNSIQSQIYTLPDETILYPGHGPNTTVKDEKYSNPFVSI